MSRHHAKEAARQVQRATKKTDNDIARLKTIKDLKPSKQSRFKQGYIDPKACKKLFESQQRKPIIYRSSWEKKFVQWLEKNPRVKRWGSECFFIPYTDPLTGTTHRYYPDYLIEMNNEVYVIEIKPFYQTQKPDPSYPPDSYTVRTYIKNKAKWNAAKEFCEEKGMHFKILTENTIQKL